MQNHPHDSICGCSVDEVHREMVTRFEKSRHVAEAMIEESTSQIAALVDTSIFAGYGEDARPLITFNTTGWERSGVVQIELDAARIYFRDGMSLEGMAAQMNNVDLSGRILVDEKGAHVPCTVEDLGLQFGYDLPDDRFRQPYSCRRVRITFEAGNVPALGLKAYAWVRSEAQDDSVSNGTALRSGERSMENEYVAVTIADNGSFTLKDKRTGRTYQDLGVYENVGDIGNEYMFKQPENEAALTTKRINSRHTDHRRYAVPCLL